jgi:hypothetical protein
MSADTDAAGVEQDGSRNTANEKRSDLLVIEASNVLGRMRAVAAMLPPR